eukprot:gene27365-36129_t
MRKDLQCAPHEPELDMDSGIFSFLRLANCSRHSLEAVCARLETGCKPWSRCHIIAASFKDGKYKKDGVVGDVRKFDIQLLRVMNGELYVDWPWGANRFLRTKKVSDLPDSVFLFAEQQAYLPWMIPFPAFCNSPSFKTAELNFPWFESFYTARQV